MNKELLKIKKESKNIVKEKSIISTRLSHLRLIIFILLLIILFISLSSTNYIGLIIFSIILSIFIVIIIIHEKIIKEIKKNEFYIKIITKYENRCNNKWKEEKSENLENLPNFVNDLDIINGNSLFKYLNFTYSLGGKNNLIDSLILKNKTSIKEITETQEAINELKDKEKFVLETEFLLSEIDKIEETDFKEYLYFFDLKKNINKIELIISSVISLITIIIATLAIFKIIPFAIFLLFVFIQIIHSYSYKLRHNEELATINKCSKKYSNLGKLYLYISNQDFISKKNKYLKEKIKIGSDTLKEINKISNLDNLRYNFITNIIFTIFFSLNFQIIRKYNKLLKEKSTDFKNSIIALEELEKIISLTTIPLVKNNITIPNIVDELTIITQDIKHPLLKEDECISNDFTSQKEINIITGSNMSGKTSFMKTIAINAILSYNGTFVNAENFSIPLTKLFTSINVKDDISNGISTFYGELKRIKDILDYSKKSNEKLIIFIDEIFKGTNYNDRILGAKETLKQLSKLNCIVFLTTHDFELCEIENKEIKNYHFAEKYKNNKIYFDYKIKTGRCKTTNAKYLMKEMGIIK